MREWLNNSSLGTEASPIPSIICSEALVWPHQILPCFWYSTISAKFIKHRWQDPSTHFAGIGNLAPHSRHSESISDDRTPP
jgi:hypothetical protein